MSQQSLILWKLLFCMTPTGIIQEIHQYAYSVQLSQSGLTLMLLQDSKGLSKFQNKIVKLSQSLSMADLARQKMGYVIEGGDAMTVL